MKVKIEENPKTSRDDWVHILRNALVIYYQFYYSKHQKFLTGSNGFNHPDCEVSRFAPPVLARKEACSPAVMAQF